jgi:poly(glycerol-phosphate) alpha-glucosyltransferase
VHVSRFEHFAITWALRESHGGMTQAMLSRCRGFVEAGVPAVDVLTFDRFAHYPRVEHVLRERGALGDGVRHMNLWNWLREPTTEPRPRPVKRPFTPLQAPAGGDDATLTRTRFDRSGRVLLQIDHLRADGSLAVIDRRDVWRPGRRGGRLIVLFNRLGDPLRSWGSAWVLYRFWLDELTRRKPAVVIVDSKTSARFMLNFQRSNVLTVHVVHGSHLAENTLPLGPLRPSRSAVILSLDRFDRLVLLSQRQRDEIGARAAGAPNLAVIPNAVDFIDTGSPQQPRCGGIMLASLIALKRVGDAITAVKSVPDTTLAIYGEGPLRAALQRRIGNDSRVTLKGYDPQAREQLKVHSFLLLTSLTEGFPLVLAEAMARGCIPIAYDIRYGPADIISDGVNGYLVPAGDVGALAAAIQRLQSLPEAALSEMRDRARATACRFSGEAVTRQWMQELDHAWRQRRSLWVRLRWFIKLALRGRSQTGAGG